MRVQWVCVLVCPHYPVYDMCTCHLHPHHPFTQVRMFPDHATLKSLPWCPSHAMVMVNMVKQPSTWGSCTCRPCCIGVSFHHTCCFLMYTNTFPCPAPPPNPHTHVPHMHTPIHTPTHTPTHQHTHNSPPHHTNTQAHHGHVTHVHRSLVCSTNYTPNMVCKSD